MLKTATKARPSVPSKFHTVVQHAHTAFGAPRRANPTTEDSQSIARLHANLGLGGGLGGGGGQGVTTQCQTKADSFRQRMQHFAVSATFNPWIKQTVDLMLLCLGPNLILWSIEATKSHRKADPIWDQFNKR